jgi:hypothetical protein
VDEKKLIQLIRDQRPEPNEAFDLHIAHQVQRLTGEEQPMKKKMSVLTIVVAVILSLALLGMAAELMGINVFEWLGRDNQRLASLAPMSVLKETAPVITNPKLEKSAACINSAYYDGQSLIVGYAIENRHYAQPFTPMQEQLTNMKQVKEHSPTDALEIEKILNGWKEAVAAHTPFGYMESYIETAWETVTDDGVVLRWQGESSGTNSDDNDSIERTIREYHSPLPEGALNKDYLNIKIPMTMRVTYHYFDGKDTYVSEEEIALEPMTATVWRTDAASRQFIGTLTYAGKPVQVSVVASAACARATLTMEDGVFAKLIAPNSVTDHQEIAWGYYEISLRDEHQTVLFANYHETGGRNTLLSTYQGTGTLPETLELQLRVSADDGVFLPPELSEVVTIQLTPVDP